ncbi:ABC transporter permease subunit [Cytobacillus sp. Sa5YUA1]|uniref:ABC transporter permease subunit n=1 Tax=Cytobacillus stercorigallinarum TaxID=2762240 RepID=A0ABR8QKQ8_9BACI|nr:ABC transporter permease [Cytobacillus stercorigallinarum]MBD7936110.1 ABC transporter permease subunit [Cytobacillus stercorigallinarum]
MNKLYNRNYALYLGIISVSIVLFFTIFGPKIAPHSIFMALEVKYMDGDVISPPLQPFESMAYPLGTDLWGYDLLSMILYGLRYTVWIAIAVAAIKMIVGTVLGMFIGTWKKTPSFIIAFEGAWSYVPAFLILYFCLLPINFGSVLETPILIAYFIVIASLVGIPSIVSSVRQKTAEIYKRDFVLASITLGAKRWRLLWRNVFPQLKESLLVMFTMEIVYVITIMGQLALLNIFIGGTIVRNDPVIYLSVTKELSGLVGQARDNLMGNQYILMVPLIILLITTISFSLLTAGLKNKFLSDYARMPWIKTGIKPKGKPSRKRLGEKRFLNFSLHKVGFAILFLLFVIGGILVHQYSDSKIGVTNENEGGYSLALSMVSDKEFTVKEEVTVKNQSEDKWEELLFFAPRDIAQIERNEITVNQENLPYEIKDGVYYISLPEKWQGENQFDVQFNYRMTGIEDADIFQDWYFALAPFKNGKWSEATKDNPYVQHHHALLSSFKVSYDLQPGYTFISSAIENDKETVSIDDVKNFSFSIVSDNWDQNERVTQKDTQVRFLQQSPSLEESAEEEIITVIDYFEEAIAPLPFKQVDIFISDNLETESLPGMVILNVEEAQDSYMIAKEVAALYYASAISQDPKNDSWIGSGLSHLAAYQYSVDQGEESKQQALAYLQEELGALEEHVNGSQVSNTNIIEVEHEAVLNAQPAWKIIELIEEHYGYRGMSPEEVGEKYLSSFYEQFAGREVDTEIFLQFTRDYFSVPSGAFSRWLNTEEVGT